MDILPPDTLETSLQKADGSGEVSITDYQGSPLLLYFTTTWGGSAEAETEQIELLTKAGITVLPVIIDSRESSLIQPELNKKLLALNACLGDEQLDAQVGGIRALPTAVLLAPDGTVADMWGGFVPAGTIIDDMSNSGD